MTIRWIFLCIPCLTTSLLISSNAIAGPPVHYNSYTVTNGVINAPCPSGATCDPSSVVSDNGFLERQVKIISTGRTYIQFILTDPGVTGDPSAAAFSAGRGNIGFTNEDFVQMGNRTNGIASYQSITASTFNSTHTLEDRFVYTSDYNFGWAQLLPPSPTPWVNLHEAISTIDYSADPLHPVEIFNTAADIASSNTSFSGDQNISLTQSIKLGGNDSQQFMYDQISGIYLPFAHPGVGSSPLLPGGTNGGDISWSAFSSIPVDALWVGQSIQGTMNDGFGYTRYGLGNSDAPLSQTSLSSFSDPNPVNWPSPPFQTAPTMGYDVVVSPTASVPPPDAPTGTGDTATIVSGGSGPLGPPVAFNNYSVAHGIITTTPCPTGVDCSTPDIVNSSGIVQRIIKQGGDQYIQTIITDNTATGTPTAAAFSSNSLGFYMENFVRVGHPDNGQGIASVSHIESQDLSYKGLPASTLLPSTGGQFAYDVTLYPGWSNSDPYAPTMVINQRTTVPDNQVNTESSFDQNFHMKIGANANDRDITIMSVTGTDRVGDTNSSIPLNFLTSPSNNTCTTLGGAVNGTNCDFITPGTGFVKPVMFETHIIGGVYQNTAHTLSDPALLPSSGDNLPWSTGDTIQATWMGARYSTSDPAGDSSIASTSDTNLSTGERVAYTSQQYPYTGQNPNPDSWVAPFGTEPLWTPTYVPQF